MNRDDLSQEARRLRRANEAPSKKRKVGQKLYLVLDALGVAINAEPVTCSAALAIAAGQPSSHCRLVPAGVAWLS